MRRTDATAAARKRKVPARWDSSREITQTKYEHIRFNGNAKKSKLPCFSVMDNTECA